MKKTSEKVWRIVIFDLLMIAILLINLLWIIADWMYSLTIITDLLQQYVPQVYDAYRPIHHDFWWYDLIFVGIFVVEIIIRWGIAIKNKTYHRWFFYPFVHWYDVLGSIPVGNLKLLRLLRVISIGIRLQKLEIIDITKYYLYHVFNKYFSIIVEEISDRVVVNVLEGVQTEAKMGTPVVGRIIHEVIEPQKDLLVNLLTTKIKEITKRTHQVYQVDLEKYLHAKISEAIEQNNEIKIVNKVPVFGEMISENIEKAVGEIVFYAINGIFADLADDKNQESLNRISTTVVDGLLEEVQIDDDDEIIQKLIVESIEVIKDQVKVQQWKVKELELKKEKLLKKMQQKQEEGVLTDLNELEQQKKEAVIADKIFKYDKSYNLDQSDD